MLTEQLRGPYGYQHHRTRNYSCGRLLHAIQAAAAASFKPFKQLCKARASLGGGLLPATDMLLAALEQVPACQHVPARLSRRNADEMTSGAALTSRAGKVTGLRLARYSTRLACCLLRAGGEEAAAGTELVNVGLGSRAVGRGWSDGQGVGLTRSGGKVSGLGAGGAAGNQGTMRGTGRTSERHCGYEARASSWSDQGSGGNMVEADIYGVYMVGDWQVAGAGPGSSLVPTY